MKKRMFKIGIFAAMLSASSFFVGCNKKADEKAAEQKDVKAGAKVESHGQVLETVDLTPGKAISPEDRAKVSSIGLKVLGHVSKAQQDIQAKNFDAAKKELTQATALLTILKKVLPTINVIDHIWVTKTNLDYVNTTPVQQDLIAIEDSIEQLYAVVPAGKAKEHTQLAKDVLKNDKVKGASKAKEELEAVEEALDFREVDLSVSYTGRLVKVAQGDLDRGKTKEAGDALQAVADGLVVFDASVIDPLDLAVRRIWIAKQAYAGKDYKTTRSRLGMAKTALEDVARKASKTVQEDANTLISKIEAIDVTKAEDKIGAALETLWQDTRKFVGHPQVADTKQPASKDKTDQIANEAFIRAADQISLAEMKLGKAAEERAASDVVRKFGMRTQRDHTLMNKELRQITTKQGIALTEKLDTQHHELLEELSKLKGTAFDQAYTKDMVAGHEAAIKQFEIEIKTGRDADVKAWAEKCLPILREHLKLAQAAAEDVKKK
jgi:putative membrane protein